MSSPYDATNPSRRVTRTWRVSKGNSDRDDLPSLDRLRGVSRDAYRNQPLVISAIDTAHYNTIGGGLKLQATPSAEILGVSADAASEWSKRVEAEWKLFSTSIDCDSERKKDFDALQQVAFISSLVSGDLPFVMPYIKRNSPYSLTIRLFEADRLCNPHFTADTPKTAGGITVGEYGDPQIYHFAKTHPGAMYPTTQWVDIPAYGKNGRRNVYLLARYVRPEQRRGVPILAPVIETLKTLSEYTTAEVEAALVSGLYTVFIKTEGGDVLPDTDPAEIKLSPGMVVSLLPGEDIETADPGRPNPNYEKFVEAIFKQIGAALQIPYELLLKHFSSSYSASRAALLEAWKAFRTRREWFAKGFCQPVYEEFLAEAILIGRISAPGFFDDPLKRMAWCSAVWNGPTPGQLDPIKETLAAEKRVQSGFSTRQKEAAEMNGTDFESNVQTAKRENQQMIESGLRDAIN